MSPIQSSPNATTEQHFISLLRVVNSKPNRVPVQTQETILDTHVFVFQFSHRKKIEARHESSCVHTCYLGLLQDAGGLVYVQYVILAMGVEFVYEYAIRIKQAVCLKVWVHFV